jgi:hypothetical protein
VSRLALATLALLIAAPAYAGSERAPAVGSLAGATVLLLPLRVEVVEVAPGGVVLLKPDWTDDATAYVQAALDSVLGGGRVALVKYATPADSVRSRRQLQVMKVHGLVRDAIITHRYQNGSALPSMRQFQWSLGPSTAVLGEEGTAARYALFVEASERRLSRHFARFGSLGNEFAATASLVDLGTGDLLWFNYERAGNVGTAGDTLSTVRRLLRDFPF